MCYPCNPYIYLFAEKSKQCVFFQPLHTSFIPPSDFLCAALPTYQSLPSDFLSAHISKLLFPNLFMCVLCPVSVLPSDLCVASFVTMPTSQSLCSQIFSFVCLSCFCRVSHLTTTFQVAVNQVNVRRDKITPRKVKEIIWKGEI